MIKIIYSTIILCTAIISCTKEGKVISCTSDNQENYSIEKFSNQEEQLKLFAKSLSKVVYNNRNVRSFLKEQALQKIDNDYDIFYPFVMDNIV